MAGKIETKYEGERIFPIPELPDEIKEAVNRQELAVFIGSGVSMIIGCNGWSELANNLVNACFDEGCIDYQEKEALIGEKNAKKKISICQHILHEHEKDRAFFEIVSESLQADERTVEKFPIYQELYKLRAVYVTTNIDKYFDNLYFKDSIVYGPRDFDPNNIDRTLLYHLHGTISDPESIVFTTRKYLEHYNHQNIREFLRNLFLKYTVVFVGYGMEELEVLDFLFTKTTGPEKVRKRFILLPMFRGQENLLNFEEFYYRDLGIDVIPYAKDERGYEQLYHVIENWQKEINLSSTFLHDSFEKIEKNIDHYDAETAKQIFQLIKNDPPLEDHLFRKLVSIEWLLPLKEIGYFDPEKNPKPLPVARGYYRIPHWNALDYLAKISEQITEKSNPKYAQTLMEIIRSICKYTGGDAKPIDNSRTNWILVKIMANLPVSYVDTEDIELIRQFLNSKWDTSLVASEVGKTLLPKLLGHKETEKALKLLEIATSVKWADDNREKPKPLMEEYWLNELLNKNRVDLSNLCPLKASEVIIDQIKKITDKNPSEFNVAQIPAIEDHPQNLFSERFQNALVRIARDLLIAAVEKGVKTAKESLNDLLQQDHPIFKRLSLSIIDKHWDTCADLFSDFADRQIFTDYNLKHEVYTLLKGHCNSFSSTVKDTLVKWIEEGPNWKKMEGDEQLRKRQLAHWKQSWLSALLPADYEAVTDLYEEYKRITKTEPEHPDFVVVTEMWSGTVSPLESPQILEKTNEEIAEYLGKYRENEATWRGPSKEGLEEALYKAVKLSPSRFDSDLKPFRDIPLNYQWRIFQGLRDAWKEKKDIAWGNILRYCKRIISDEGFWKVDEEASHYRDWVVSQVADLIVEGTKDDSHAFAPTYLPIAEEMILEMLENTRSDLQYPDDLITATLNSAKGRVISSLVNYAWRVARLKKDKAIEVKWSKKIKEEISERLNRNIEPSLEWDVSLGEYLPLLYYLDKSWVAENINRIFLKESEAHWKAAMEGYLFEPRVHEPIYVLLKRNGHYQMAMDIEFKNKDVRKRLVDHMCILYLNKKENLTGKDSLFSQFLDAWKPSDILEMISFFWMQRKYLVEYELTQKPELEDLRIAQIRRILDFWRCVYGKLKDKSELSEDEKRILGNMGLLLCFMDRIDEERLSWLTLTAKFVGHINSHFFIEYLDDLCDNSPHAVGAVFLAILDYLTPDYPKEHIRTIVHKLYSLGERHLADRICNIYFTKGFEFLRDIYEKNKTL